MDPNSNIAWAASAGRQFLQVGAGLLIARGVVDESTATLALGAVTSLSTFGWHLYERRRLARAPAVK
jgi:hypothetical protein